MYYDTILEMTLNFKYLVNDPRSKIYKTDKRESPQES